MWGFLHCKISKRKLQKCEGCCILLKLIHAKFNHSLFSFWRIPSNDLSRLKILQGVTQAANEILN